MNKKHRKAARKTVEMFFAAWMNYDWSDILNHTQITWKDTREGEYIQEYFRTYYAEFDIERFAIGSSTVVNDYTLDVAVSCNLTDGTKPVFLARVICESDVYKPDLDGVWGINPASVFRSPNR